MKNLAIIPARGGSKRIPKKNIRSFYGKPIIEYVINAAKETNLFDEIMVSTEDEEIANIVTKMGAKVPFLRSKENADDYATIANVINEVTDSYSKMNQKFDNYCCLLATAPLIRPMRIVEGYNLFIDKKFDSLNTLLPFPVPVETGFRLTDEGKVEMLNLDIYGKRYQDIKKTYYDAGQFYWMKPESVKKNNRIATENTGAVVLTELEAHDIDSIEDWNIAEFKYKYNSELNKK